MCYTKEELKKIYTENNCSDCEIYYNLYNYPCYHSDWIHSSGYEFISELPDGPLECDYSVMDKEEYLNNIAANTDHEGAWADDWTDETKILVIVLSENPPMRIVEYFDISKKDKNVKIIFYHHSLDKTKNTLCIDYKKEITVEKKLCYYENIIDLMDENTIKFKYESSYHDLFKEIKDIMEESEND